MGTNTGIGIGIGIPFKNNVLGEGKPYLPPEIKDSLKAVVIAYGKTNNDSDRAIVKNLVDASNPFVISNAAFKLNSGFGKYEITFQYFPYIENVTNVSDSKVVFGIGGQLLIPYSAITENIPSFKIKVNGLSGTYHFRYYYRSSDGVQHSVNMAQDGYYELPICYNVQSSSDGTDCGFANNGNDVVTITQIPSFEGAFVTDGVDDLITSTKTAQEMGITDEITVVSMIGQLSTSNVNNYTNTIRNQLGTTGSYNKIAVSAIDKTGIYGYSFDSSLKCSIINDILGDKQDYSVSAATQVENIGAKYLVQGWIDINGLARELSSVAWYWTIIANKVLTTDQINQVIAYFNLDRTLKPDILCNTIKQGITNENHAEFGDKLIDFSGNGRDIQLNNLAWDGDSGIGKYNYPNWKVTATIANTYSTIVNYPTVNGTYSINVNGVSELMQSIGLHLEIKYTTSTGIIYNDIKQDGVYSYILPDGATDLTLRFGGIPGIVNEPCNITITQIPSHAGALCFDGVEDYGKVTGLPIYKDYTVVARYQRLVNDYDDIYGGSPVLSKSPTSGQGAFLFNTRAANGIQETCSFGLSKGIPAIDDMISGVYYQSKYINNGVTINTGTAEDSTDMWLGTFRDNDPRFFNGAIYSLMTFPYSMSEFLIERQLKKHKLGTLYPDMVEFRPVIKANANYKITYYQIDSTNTWKSIKVGDYIVIGAKLAFQITFDNDASELKEVVSPQLSGIIVEKRPSNPGYNIYSYITSKSPQKINITIDEYIRYEDIVQPYPSLFTLIDYDTEEVYSWGSKLKVGARFKGNVVNLLPNMYEWQGDVLYNGEVLNWGINPGVVAKEMVFSWNMPFKYLIDNNEPKCILSPRLLRIPNSSYKILGYIPDISGHGNNGVIHNSAYAEGSGVNEDGSYQFDGVDDFVTIPTVTGGKQVLMKVNWQSDVGAVTLYDQRLNLSDYEFAIYNGTRDLDDNPVIAYQGRNNGQTYIDGILNSNIMASELKAITHNITITNELSLGINNTYPVIGSTRSNTHFAQMSLYDFMLFDNISTDDKIKQLNEYVGIEAKVELPPYYWDAYGKTNLDGDKATIQQRGVAVGDYDLTNNNFAYDNMSGFGGYTLGKFTNSWSLSNNSNSISIVARNPYDITLKKLGGNSDWEFNTTELKIISNPVSVKFKSDKNIRFTCDYHYYTVGGNSEGAPLGITSKDLIANEDTIITISPISQENIDKYNIDINRGYYLIYFQLSLTLAVNEEVTIEMLPLYPNGLVYDGVTDYSYNINIPALTDYTYILKRQILKGIANSAVMYKGNITVNQGGAFICNYCEPSDTNLFTDFSFGGLLRSNDIDKPIIYGTKTSVNGDSITPGENIDTVGINVGK